MGINVFLYNNLNDTLEIKQDFESLILENHKVWVDLFNPSATDLEKLEKFFYFHFLTIEDCIEGSNNPKIDHYDDYIFVVANSLVQNIENEGNLFLVKELDIFLGRNYIVTHHKDPIPAVEITMDGIKNNRKLLKRGTDFVFHQLIDNIVDKELKILEIIDDKIDEIEEVLFHSPDQNILNELFSLKKEIVNIKKTSFYQRDVFFRLSRRKINIISRKCRFYIKDAYDHHMRFIDNLESFREFIFTSFDIYNTSISNKTNQVVKLLTIITTMMMPLTVITGFFGMNFKFMPLLETDYGYLITSIFMVVLGVVMVLFFRLKKWI